MLVLVAVVEAGSLSAASRRLGMPLATVSRRILLVQAAPAALAHLPAADPDAAEHEMERLLRCMHYMWRLSRLAGRTPALTPGSTSHG